MGEPKASSIPKFNSRLPEYKFKFGIGNQNQNIQATSAVRSNLRRSKSFSDLNTVSGSGIKPLLQKKEFKVLKPISETNIVNSNNKTKNLLTVKQTRKSKSFSNLLNTATSTNTLKSVSTRNVFTGTKRPLPTSNSTKPDIAAKRARPIIKKVEEKKGNENKVPEKPKITKPASYDYKARFNLLNEKHTTLRKNHTEIKEKYEEITSEVECLKHENEKLLVKNDLLEKDQVKLKTVEIDLKNIQREVLKCKNENQSLIEEKDILNNKFIKLKDTQDLLEKTHKNLSQKHNHLEAELKTTLEQLEEYKERLQEEEDVRRQLHNTIQDMKGNIRVFCRVRPQLSGENDRLISNINFIDEITLELKKSKESVTVGTSKLNDLKIEFSFDKVFPPEATQYEIFEDLAQLIQSALDGYHVCVFAYGQTGSGKTYTMQGDSSSAKLGMIPRSMEFLFKTIKKLKKIGWQYSVDASFLEIYNEIIKDLLDTQPKHHEIRFNEGRGVTITNLKVQPIESEQEFKEYMLIAQNNRAVAATNFNEHSSRSHAITKIYLNGVNTNTNITYKGSINLVDLAGSESAKTSCNERLMETKNINRSLSALGNVIMALHNKDIHIPYRNSKLTYALQSCLGGNSKTLMVVNVSPLEDCYLETVNSLRFASKVKEVKTSSRRNKTYVQDNSI